MGRSGLWEEDVFDLWHALKRGGVDADAIVRCFRAYLAHGGLSVPRAEFMANLDEKAGDPVFTGDVPLPSVEFDHDEALKLIRERLVALV
jgi:hypothetical protein